MIFPSKIKEKKFEYETYICPECGNNFYFIQDYSRGEIICGECGIVVLDHVIDHGPEWRAYDSTEKENRTRTGGPISFRIYDKGLSTIIDRYNQDFLGRKIASNKRAQLYRLRYWQFNSHLHRNIARNLNTAMNELDRLASQIELSANIKEMAAFIYRKAAKGQYLKGKVISETVAASIYVACHIYNFPILLEELATHSKANKKNIARTYRYLIECLNLKIRNINPLEYIVRFSEELNLSPNIQLKACKIIQLAYQKNLTSGKDPKGLAAAVIYIAGLLEGEHCSQRKISRVSHVSEVTIRNRYKEIVEKLDLKLYPIKNKKGGSQLMKVIKSLH
ncbi:MAG: transcription initiation factor IIB [Candidatus Helarchaeota archaeon]